MPSTRTFSSHCNSSSYWLAFFFSFFTFAVFSWMEWRVLLRVFSSWNTNQRGITVRRSERGKSFGRSEEGIPTGARRTGEGEVPEAGRKSACYLTDAYPTLCGIIRGPLQMVVLVQLSAFEPSLQTTNWLSLCASIYRCRKTKAMDI